MSTIRPPLNDLRKSDAIRCFQHTSVVTLLSVSSVRVIINNKSLKLVVAMVRWAGRNRIQCYANRTSYGMTGIIWSASKIMAEVTFSSIWDFCILALSRYRSTKVWIPEFLFNMLHIPSRKKCLINDLGHYFKLNSIHPLIRV